MMNDLFLSSYIKATLANTVHTPQPKHKHTHTHHNSWFNWSLSHAGIRRLHLDFYIINHKRGIVTSRSVAVCVFHFSSNTVLYYPPSPYFPFRQSFPYFLLFLYSSFVPFFCYCNFYCLFLKLSPTEEESSLERVNEWNSSSVICSGYYHMIISDGQLASKMFHYERARWDLISTHSLRAAASASSAQGNYISITRAWVNKATLKECEGATAPPQKNTQIKILCMWQEPCWLQIHCNSRVYTVYTSLPAWWLFGEVYNLPCSRLLFFFFPDRSIHQKCNFISSQLLIKLLTCSSPPGRINSCLYK